MGTVSTYLVACFMNYPTLAPPTRGFGLAPNADPSHEDTKAPTLKGASLEINLESFVA
jgi:hypothetical protein